MARGVLLVVGIGFVLWGVLSFSASAFMPDWLGIDQQDRADRYIEFIAINVGLWPAVGAFALFGAAAERLRIPAILTVLVCNAGVAAGRILALVNGANAGVYTSVALAIEVAIVAACSAAYVSERTRLSREAKARAAALPKQTSREPTAPAKPSTIKQ